MKKILTLLVVACVSFVAVGCDPAPKTDDTTAPGQNVKASTPPAKTDAPAKPASE